MAEVETSWGRFLHLPRTRLLDHQTPPVHQQLESSPTQSMVVRLPGERSRIDICGQRSLIFPMSTTPLTTAMVQASVRALRDLGFGGWIESIALADEEVHGFRSAGFHVRQSLCLLTRDLYGVLRHTPHAPETVSLRPITTNLQLRRPAITDQILRIDALAFGEESSLDQMGLRHSLTATKQVRVCGAWHGDELLGFAISGKVGRATYLQRLAVNPAVQGQGAGSVLCKDALAWAKRQRARRMVVNTQYDNQRALELYERHGFERASTGLTVMGYFSDSRASR